MIQSLLRRADLFKHFLPLIDKICSNGRADGNTENHDMEDGVGRSVRTEKMVGDDPDPILAGFVDQVGKKEYPAEQEYI